MQKHKLKNLLKLMVFVSLNSLIGCKKNETQNLDFTKFNASVPLSWRKINLKGAIDSEVTGILTDKNDTIIVEIGKFSDPFNEIVEVRSLKLKAEYDSVKFRYPSSMIFSENPEIDQAQGLYLKEYFFYENIDGKKAKLGFPKLFRNGRCLLHISNFDKLGNSLSIYVNESDSTLQNEMYIFFKSIKFYKSGISRNNKTELKSK